LENLKERELLIDLSGERGTILKWTFKKCERVDWIQLAHRMGSSGALLWAP